MYLNESVYHRKNNPNPRRFRMMFRERSRSQLQDGAVCVKLAGVRPDKFDSEKKMMWVWNWRPGVVVSGLNLPGYVETL